MLELFRTVLSQLVVQIQVIGFFGTENKFLKLNILIKYNV